MPRKGSHDAIKNDYLVIDGIYFYKESDGNGYYLGNVKIPGRKRKYPMRAHIYVWEKYNGKVPNGYDVHHIDHDPRNNDISNLELLPEFDHLSMHGNEHADASRENLIKRAIPAAAEWHHSKEAIPVHRDIYEQYSREIFMKPVTKVCQYCGKEYTTTYSSASRSKFCSNKCRAAARRKSGVDNIAKICENCGKPFIANKYASVKYCPECSFAITHRHY